MNNLLFILLVVVSIQVLGQSRSQHAVYLKNGSVLRGQLVEENTQRIAVKIAGGSVFLLQAEEVDTVILETHRFGDGTIYQQRPHGYCNISGIGVPVGSGIYYDYYSGSSFRAGFNAYTLHGYRFRNYFLAGAGIALDIMDHAMLQGMAEFRYEPLRGQATPYVYGAGGYGLDLTSSYSDGFQEVSYAGGPLAGAGIGMRFNFYRSGAFLLDAGYRWSTHIDKVEYTAGGGGYVNTYTANRLLIRMGLGF